MSHSDSDIILTKINSFISNEINDYNENSLYNFKFNYKDKYNGGWQISTKFKIWKNLKITKINNNNNFMHLSSSTSQMTLYKYKDMFYMHSTGDLSGRI